MIYNIKNKELASISAKIITKQTTLDKEIQSGNVKISGNANELKANLAIFDTFTPDFNIVTP